MPLELGPRDDQRFASLGEEEREYLAFQIDFCFTVLEQRPNQIEALGACANALTALGYYHDGLAMDRRLATIRPRDPTVLYNLACSLALTGRAAEALETLETSVARGWRDARLLGSDPDLEAIREEPRFRAILDRLRPAQTRSADPR